MFLVSAIVSLYIHITHQLRQLCHEQRHLLGGGDDVVVLARPLLHLLVEVVGGHLEVKSERGKLGSAAGGVKIPEKKCV